MADTLKETLDGFVKGQEAARKSIVTIEAEADPAKPGRTAYRITGADKRAVEHAIAARMREAEEFGGQAHFIGPARIDGGLYGAIGEVFVAVSQPHAQS